jgi:radical SAM protein with 4Fe4S-binding SPASM domain
MRVSNNIRVLKGAKRFALYNLDHSFVEPISELQAGILKSIASGNRAKYSDFGVSRREFWSEIGSLKKLGAFRAGSPKKTDIEFKVPETDFKLLKFDQAWLEVTNSCNLSCSHCYSESSPRVDRSDELELESWKVIVAKLADQGIDLITLIGGEPLVRQKLIGEIIPYIKVSYPEIQVNVFSNLTILPTDDELISILKEYKVRIGTSLYGLESTSHDSMTNRIGSWNKTISNIEKLTKSDIGVFAGFYRSSSCNLEEREIADFIEGLGVTEYEILSPSQVGRGSDTEWKVINLENRLPKRKYFNYSSPYKNMQVHNCFADRLSINQAGEVLPCIMARNVSYGNILTSSLKEILESSNYEKYSSLTKDNIEGCSDCEFKYGCFDCRPDAQAGSHNLLKKPDCGYSPYDEL